MGDRDVQKNFAVTLAEQLSDVPKHKAMEIWFQDEARIGQSEREWK